MPKHSDFDTVAYHEAGHAVAAWLLGIGVQRISVEPTVDARAHVLFEQYDDQGQSVSAAELTMLQKRILMDVAGLAAEYTRLIKLGSGRPDQAFLGNFGDQEQANDRLLAIRKPGCFMFYVAMLSRKFEERIVWAVIERTVELLRNKTILTEPDFRQLRAQVPDLRLDANFWAVLEHAHP